MALFICSADFPLFLLLPNVFLLYALSYSHFSPIKNSRRYFHVFILYFFTNNTHFILSLSLSPSRSLLILLLDATQFFFYILYFHPKKKKTFLCGFEMYKCFYCLRVYEFVCVCVNEGKWKNNAPKNGILIFLQYIFISI